MCHQQLPDGGAVVCGGDEDAGGEHVDDHGPLRARGCSSTDGELDAGAGGSFVVDSAESSDS